jgi:hypothetical protein
MDISKVAAALGKKGGAARTRAKIKAAKINGKARRQAQEIHRKSGQG